LLLSLPYKEVKTDMVKQCGYNIDETVGLEGTPQVLRGSTLKVSNIKLFH